MRRPRQTACCIAACAGLSLVLLAFVLLSLWTATGAAQEPADVVFRNGRIYTVHGELPLRPQDEPTVEAIAARQGRIVALGSWRDVQAFVGPATQVHDLHGAAAVPGLVDAHAHMRNLGRLLHSVNLVGTRSYDEVIARVRAAADRVPAGTWIHGRGWDQNDWEDNAFPDHAALSRAVPDHPVWIRRVDGHAALGNALALQEAGVDAATTAPVGGRILRRADGSPTGVFVDAAEDLVRRVIPPVDQAQRVRWFRSAMDHMLQLGLTGMHDAGVTGQQLQAYRWLLQRGELRVRVYAMHDARPDTEDGNAYEAALRQGPVDFDPTGRLATRCVKFALDGALGSRGAALLAPYRDEPDSRGLPQHTREELEALLLPLHEAGFQIAVHAIGDAANRTCLDVFEELQRRAPRPDARHRIEHAQVLSPADIPRFARLGVLPSMQPTHCTSDMPWAGERLGPERLLGAYAWRSLRDTGVVLPGGSDAPVESIDPLHGLYAAVTRQDVDGRPIGGWAPEQRLTRSEALRSFTLWAARAAFAEDDLGSLEVGKWLDLSVFDRDIVLCEASDLLRTHATMTVVSGEIAYESP